MKRNSQKINVCCALSYDTVIGSFFFAETSLSAKIYLDMSQIYGIPQMQHLQPTIIFQQAGVPPHSGTDGRAFLDTTIPNQRNGHGGPIVCPPRSPNVTPLDFVLLGLRERQSLLKGDL
ncbi:hypothetical protein AVEN_121930-1 [Araneus ventricosus]|uniref:Uncharacterized protein n=1 Tax=Araneus ventricosus TaxID=182803 RepID=A0A4Y2W8E0_ARAVE|nr:hypothetical protein AVEN_121930-1 [Araneus ventricosus]